MIEMYDHPSLNSMFLPSKVWPKSLQHAKEYGTLPSSTEDSCQPVRLAISEERSIPPLSKVEDLFPPFLSCFTCFTLFSSFHTYGSPVPVI